MRGGVDPLLVQLDAITGLVTPEDATTTVERRLSDMKGMDQDAEATAAMLAEGDPLLYRVSAPRVPDEAEHLVFGITTIESGKVGDEFFMTKGHFHAVEQTAEVYQGLSGRGMIVMETRDGRTAEMPLEPGGVVYIPPGWAHRSVNVGDEPFVFFYVMPGGAGHDYATFADAGFRRIVVELDGSPTVRPNPRLG